MATLTAYADAANARNDWYSPDEAYGSVTPPYNDGTSVYAFNLSSQQYDELYLDLNDTTLAGLPDGATISQIDYGVTIRYGDASDDQNYYLNLNSNSNVEYGSVYRTDTPNGDDTYGDDEYTITTGLPSVATIKSGGLSVEVDPSGAGDGTFRVIQAWATITYTDPTVEETVEAWTETAAFTAPTIVQQATIQPWDSDLDVAAHGFDVEGAAQITSWTETVEFASGAATSETWADAAVTWADAAVTWEPSGGGISVSLGDVTYTVGEWTETVDFEPPTVAQIAAPTPPPVPWQTLLASSAWTTAIGARQRTTACRVDLVDDAGSVVASFGQDSSLGGIVAGSVVCDGDRAVRWSCNLTLSNPDLVPTAVDDLLGPLSRLRARVWWLIRLADGTWGEVPVGTYVLGTPSVADSADEFAISIVGDDPVAQIKQARMIDMLDVSGMRVDLALVALLEDRAPWLASQITPVEYELPSMYVVGEPGADPWEEALKIAAAGNLELYADRLGVIVGSPDRVQTTVKTVGWVEGNGCTMTSINRQWTTDDLLNEYMVESASPDLQADDDQGEPAGVAAIIRDNDPTSPTWVGHGRIYSDVYSTDAFTTVEQCRDYGESVMRRRRAWIDSVELQARARPDLDPGNLVEISRQRSQITGVYELRAWSAALGPNAQMRARMAARRSPWTPEA